MSNLDYIKFRGVLIPVKRPRGVTDHDLFVWVCREPCRALCNCRDEVYENFLNGKILTPVMMRKCPKAWKAIYAEAALMGKIHRMKT